MNNHNSSDTARKEEIYVTTAWGGLVLPGKHVTVEQLQGILDKSIYNGIYGSKKLKRLEFLYSVSVLSAIMCAFGSLIAAIKGDITWVVLAAGMVISGVFIQKYITVTSLLKKYDQVMILVPRIKRITYFPPKVLGCKDYISEDRPVLGFFLPKKIVAFKCTK